MIATYFDFSELAIVLGVLQDKDAAGIIDALAPVAKRFHVTQSRSDRAVPYVDLAGLVLEMTNEDATHQFESFEHAVHSAREWAAEEPRRGVLVTGSITLVGEAIALAAAEGWKR
jgi:dihydrofolate synthase/folylpolyglutamate synthase